MKEITVKATLDNLETVQNFVNALLDEALCKMKAQMQIEIAVEEIYVNIAHYAYGDGEGDAVIAVDIIEPEHQAMIRFTDSGIPFNPLAKEDADVTLSAKDRQIGGLGIFMVKKSMDRLEYVYEDNKNIFTIYKAI